MPDNLHTIQHHEAGPSSEFPAASGSATGSEGHP
ncbi:hypothetical protein SAMN06269185_1433 [Natronoarchaeum philippinense]|uniref:Uncharacterized protein n=1 Tax=Natronoarchaeum philippinense TaxID=558529 RepID=A0A285NQY3_NATPI|nr:hypothetical protein SAMN06269185_1433 [Natronoarchaeum philippinense]